MVRDLIKTALGHDPEDNDGLVSAVEAVFTILLALNLAFYAHIKPSRVGVHPCNQYGSGVVASWMHALMAQLVRMGWSSHACAGAVCVEDDDNRTCAIFTHELQSGSDMLGKQHFEEIDFGSLACGHTNQGLVAIESGVPCEHAILSCDGKMSKSKVVAKRPNMAAVFEYGMYWLVLKAVTIKLFLENPRFVQAARQAIGQVQKVEGIFELLKAVQSLIPSAGKTTDWSMIQEAVGASESPFKADVLALCEYARLYGGGEFGD